MKRNAVSTTGIAYHDSGSGPAVLLIHAFGFDASMWEPQRNFLTDNGFRVLAHDHRGFGESPGPVRNHTFSNSVADAIGVLDHAGVQSAIAVGVSMGAATAVALATSRPERISGIVLADNSRPDGRERGRDAAARIRALGMEQLANVYEPILFGPSFRESNPDYIAHWRKRLIERSAEDLARIVEPYHGRPDPRPQLTEISIPTALVFGRQDAAIPESRRDDYAPIPTAEHFRIEEAGHMSNIERPDEFNEVLASVIGRTFPSRFRLKERRYD